MIVNEAMRRQGFQERWRVVGSGTAEWNYEDGSEGLVISIIICLEEEEDETQTLPGVVVVYVVCLRGGFCDEPRVE